MLLLRIHSPFVAAISPLLLRDVLQNAVYATEFLSVRLSVCHIRNLRQNIKNFISQ